MIIYQFSGAVLAGLGLNYLENIKLKKIKKIIFIIISIFFISFITFIFIQSPILNILKHYLTVKFAEQGGTNYNSPQFYFNALTKIYNNFLYNIFYLILILTTFYIIIKLAIKRNIKIAPLGLLILSAIEITHFHSKFLNTIEIKKNIIPEKILNSLDKNSRVYFDSKILLPNTNFLYNLKAVNAYEPFILKNYDIFSRKFELSKNIPVNIRIIKPDYKSNLFDLLSAKYIFSDSLINISKFRLLNKFNKIYLYENKNSIPLYFISNNLIKTSATKILKKLEDKNFNYQKNAYNTEIEISNNSPLKYTIKSSEISNDNAEFNISVNHKCIFVFNYVYYPAWSVYINDKPVKLLNINHLFMGCILKKGNNHIKFKFNLY
jgi:hypothetical protein